MNGVSLGERHLQRVPASRRMRIGLLLEGPDQGSKISGVSLVTRRLTLGAVLSRVGECVG